MVAAMSAASPLTELRGRVQQTLNEFVDAKRRQLAALGQPVEEMVSAAQQAVVNGKRLRAGYCYWGWRAAGGDRHDDRVMRAAAALEWLQSSALVHDDIMDASDVRRGRPALHRAFAERHKMAGWRGDPEQYGISAAILLGDLLLAWVDEMFHDCGLPPTALARALPYLDACKTEVVAGQFLDLANQASGDSSVEAAMRVVRFKAAKYTVERPLHLGAALAGAGKPLLDHLSGYGLPVGEAFQLRDDVLGAFGNAAVTGKPAGDDLRQGKRTVLLAKAHQLADERQRRLLDEGVGRADLDADAVARLCQVIVSTGALARVEEQIETLRETALGALDSAAVDDDEARHALRVLADLSVRRQS